MADLSQSVLRRLRELYDNPKANLEMLTDRLDNFNKGRVAEVRPDSAGYRTLTDDERVRQITQGVQDNIGGAGMGALGSIRLYRGMPYATGWKSPAVENIRTGQTSEAARRGTRKNTGQYVWSSSNPNVAESYAGDNGLIIPLEVDKPDAVLDAGGKFWNEYFYGKNGTEHVGDRSPLKALEFQELMRDPNVRNIMVKNIIDPGNRGLLNISNRYPELEFDDLLRQQLMGNNMLIKDPTSVRYGITGEIGNFKQGGLVEHRQGGLVQMKHCNCGSK